LLDISLKICHFTLEECERLGTALVSRLMPYAANIQLTPEQQDELERGANGRTVAARAVERARIILRSAAGTAKREIAEQLGIARQTVRRWEKRFLQQATAGLKDAPRSGTAAPHPTRADRADRPEDHPGNACRFHPLEHAELGPSGERKPLVGGADLA
jgi:DNA-binding transcriptional regulator YiaG